MGIADSVSRLKKENNKDFYQTPYLATEALLKSYSFIHEAKTILDPCEGAGAITKILKKYDINYKGIDKYPQLESTQEIDFLRSEMRQHIDVIISNPPYSLKNEFIDDALNSAEEVFFILPMQVVNYNYFHRNYLNRKEYRGRLLMTPKFFMTQDVNEDYSLVKGGVSAYAWFHWSKNKTIENHSYETYIDLDILKKKLENE